jgi:2-polyprenyl-3-methyl-5-hydroxy-6-metoxy-1,4-benzoquinol methylase
MMTAETQRKRARELAAESLARGDPTGWFETLYAEGGSGRAEVPWDDRTPNPGLVEYWAAHRPPAQGRRAIVVGCGFGDDAEFLAAQGFATTAFDLAPSAIRGCRARFPHTTVDYEVADLRDVPPGWIRRFDLVVECFTIQAVPPESREGYFGPIASLVAPGGGLLVIARARTREEPSGELPWPLTREELVGFGRHGLTVVSVEEYFDRQDPPVRRFRAYFERSTG